MDETYMKVEGKDMFLYRTVDNLGKTVDSLLTKRRPTERTLSGIEVVSIIKKDQIKDPSSTSFKTFCSLIA